jgi:Zn-dependent peptidase ImmA (M78 family)
MFERGFKSWSENISLKVRKELELPQIAPLNPAGVADYLGVRLWSTREIEGLSEKAIRILLGTESDAWSAVTVSFAGKDCIIYNPKHSDGRQSNDVMHELAHVLIGHDPATLILSPDGAMAVRTFNRQQEDEANWLAGALLLPRPALLLIAGSDQPPRAVCEEYRVSEPMLQWRLNVSGARTQVGRARRVRLGR